MFKKLTLSKLLAILLFMIPALPATAQIAFDDTDDVLDNVPFTLQVDDWAVDDAQGTVQLLLKANVFISGYMVKTIDVSCALQADGQNYVSSAVATNIKPHAPRLIPIHFDTVRTKPDKYVCVVMKYELDFFLD